MSTLTARFWPKVKKENGCWAWTAGRNSIGYGLIGSGGKMGKPLRAHRVSWEIHKGPIPFGMHVLHRCDNPSCVNPEHLFLGSNYDNVQDMVRKGRNTKGDRHRKTMKIVAARGDENGSCTHPEKVPKGESHFNALMTEIKVIKMREMRRSGHRNKDLAKLFRISPQETSLICNRRRWKHVI